MTIVSGTDRHKFNLNEILWSAITKSKYYQSLDDLSFEDLVGEIADKSFTCEPWIS